MAKVYGIAAGGLFNEIYEAHLKNKITRTKTTHSPDEQFSFLTVRTKTTCAR